MAQPTILINLMCAGRTVEGDQPYCVYNCPTQAMWYGDLEDEDSEVVKKLEELRDRDFRPLPYPRSASILRCLLAW